MMRYLDEIEREIDETREQLKSLYAERRRVNSRIRTNNLLRESRKIRKEACELRKDNDIHQAAQP